MYCKVNNNTTNEGKVIIQVNDIINIDIIEIHLGFKQNQIHSFNFLRSIFTPKNIIINIFFKYSTFF